MRTKVEIDDELMAEALESTGLKTKREELAAQGPRGQSMAQLVDAGGYDPHLRAWARRQPVHDADARS